MLSGYSEVLAYSCCDTPKISKDTSQQPFGGTISKEEFEDFILISECCENSGPMPILTIPSKGAHLALDMNRLTIKIMSTDHQILGAKGRIPEKDTFLFLAEIVSTFNVVVCYSLLLDTQARGYVRPFCVAYFSQDKLKLIKNLRNIMNSIGEAMQAITIINRKMFLHEIGSYIDSGREKIPGEPSKEELISLKETVASHIYSLKNLDSKLDDFLQNLINLPNDVLPKSMQENLEFIINIQIQQLNPFKGEPPSYQISNLRHATVISLGGMMLGLYHLYIIHKFFKRKNEHILIQKETEKFKNNYLTFGACVKSSTKNSENTSKPVYACGAIYPIIPNEPKVDSNFVHLDRNYLKLLKVFKISNFPTFKKNNPEFNEEEGSSTVSSSEILNMDSSLRKKAECSWHGYSLDNIWDVLDFLGNVGAEATFHNVLRQVSQTSDILFSLLIGRPIIVAGQNQETVEHVVMCLGALVPLTEDKPKWMDLFQSKPLSNEILENKAVVGLFLQNFIQFDQLIPPYINSGVSVINLNSNTFSGANYSGFILQDLNQRLLSLPKDSPVMAMLVSSLIDVEHKAQFWFLSTNCLGDYREPSAYFMRKGYSTNDISIFKHLSQSFTSQEQMTAPSTV